jgi:muramoyltetrapeptide carboxypeptidase LdcA involved in peptidoglycan recycling
MIKPPKLCPGDQVAAVSLSWGGPGAFPIRYEVGKRQLQDEFGVRVVESPNALRDPGWLHGNPKARADDLMWAFSDSSIKAVFSTIGGEDSIRILPYLDLNVIRSNPKIFMGYSDTTISHFACYRAGLGSFYGPAFMAGFAENGGMLPYMIESMRRTLFSSAPIGEISPNLDGWTNQRLDWAVPENQSCKRELFLAEGWRFLQGRGIRRGHLLGGCFEVFDWLRGTDFFPSLEAWQDAILFLETSEEAPSPTLVCYGLRALAALGVLRRLSGILFGRPGGFDLPVEKFAEYDRVLMQVVSEEEGLTDLPIITHMDFGHTDPMFVLPYGLQAEIDCDACKFSILEGAVLDSL